MWIRTFAALALAGSMAGCGRTDPLDPLAPPDAAQVDAPPGIVTLAAPRHPRAMAWGWAGGPEVVFTDESSPGSYTLQGSDGAVLDAPGNWGAAIAAWDGGGIAWMASIHPARARYVSFSGGPARDLDFGDRLGELPGHYGAVMAMGGRDAALTFFYV
ncbi:MAG: hypothetical protein ABI175_22255, partial [Polyangiales bacterium]